MYIMEWGGAEVKCCKTFPFMNTYITCMTIAGSDPSGGAGIQADIKTFAALGCYAQAAVTALTVQNTLGVQAVQAIKPDVVAGQIRAVMDDVAPVAIKIGMVNDRPTLQAIADALRPYHPRFVVVDPVMVSTSGSPLMQPDAVDAFCQQLLPMATVLTPNLPEAEVLAHMPIRSFADMDEAARRILQLGCKAVLIKGGHWEGQQKVDRLYMPGQPPRSYEHPAIETRNTHGTGCTLSSAIAAYLAKGAGLDDAVRLAKQYIDGAIAAGAEYKIGGGHGPVYHFYKLWQ